MSVNEAMVILKDVKQFSVGSAEFIVLEVARGASVKELHEHHEDMVPSPLVVNRWRRSVPAFDMLMREAEEAKAQGLADEVVKIAGDEDRQAAISGNMIKARQWLSGQLSEQFRSEKVAGSVKVDMNVRLTDEQLMAIAQGKYDGKVIEAKALGASHNHRRSDEGSDPDGREAETEAQEVVFGEPGSEPDGGGPAVESGVSGGDGWGFLNGPTD